MDLLYNEGGIKMGNLGFYDEDDLYGDGFDDDMDNDPDSEFDPD